MATAKWDPLLETGNELVDSEHRAVFDLVVELHDSIVRKQSREAQDEILDHLIAHVEEHFVHEEALMRSMHYPGLVEQKRLHKEFTKEAGRLVAEHKAGEARLPITVAIYVYDWVLNHIRVEDRKIGEFIRAKQTGAN